MIFLTFLSTLVFLNKSNSYTHTVSFFCLLAGVYVADTTLLLYDWRAPIFVK